nr:hypothetical protein [Candidatus Njordarchaeum guaymaensis]
MVERFSAGGAGGLGAPIESSHPRGSLIHASVNPSSARPENPTKSSERFESAVLEAVDYGLGVLGETVRQAIYSYIDLKYQIKREETPKNLDVFRKASAGLFGAGGRVVEKLIARKLYGMLGLSFTDHENWTLIDYVNDGKKRMAGS